MNPAVEQLNDIIQPLQSWMDDKAVTDIMVNRPHEAFIRRNGQYERHPVALDYDDCVDIAILAGSLNKQNVNSMLPLVGTELPNGERLQAVIPPCVPQGTAAISLRIHEAKVAPVESVPKRYDTSRWNRWEHRHEARKADYKCLLDAYDSGDIVLFMREVVRLKFTPVLGGHTGAGKSTYLKTLVSLIDPMERIITIENALELDIINQLNYVRFLYSHGEQSTTKVGQHELLQALLRMRPDRTFVGELRDPDATYVFFDDMTTGHRGSATTVHGADAPQVALRLFTQFKASKEGQNYRDEMVINQLASAIDVIIPFQEVGGTYQIGEVWISCDAERREKSFHELLENA